MNPNFMTAYLVEDEPLCRADFRQTLRDLPEVRLIGEAETLTTAKSFLTHRTVDLLFLDLSVGQLNGLDLLENLPRKPMVIALTAHPQHAVRGFALDLVDYILKPVEKERLQVALKKAFQRKSANSLKPESVTFIAEIEGKKTTLNLDEILGAEAMGNYVILHTTRGKAIKRSTFKNVRKKLNSAFFMEPRRGWMVARRFVQSWHRNAVGKLELILADQSTLTVPHTHTAMVLKTLENF